MTKDELIESLSTYPSRQDQVEQLEASHFVQRFSETDGTFLTALRPGDFVVEESSGEIVAQIGLDGQVEYLGAIRPPLASSSGRTPPGSRVIHIDFANRRVTQPPELPTP